MKQQLCATIAHAADVMAKCINHHYIIITQMIKYKATANPLNEGEESKIKEGNLWGGKWAENKLSEVCQLIEEWDTQTLRACTCRLMKGATSIQPS